MLDDLRFKHYHSQTDRYLQLFHRRPVAAALYKKVCYIAIVAKMGSALGELITYSVHT